MLNYHHILLATDLLDEGNRITDVAIQLAQSSKARLSIIHVMENTPIIYGGGNEFSVPLNLNLEEKLRNEVEQILEKLVAYMKQQGVTQVQTHIKTGSAKYGIIDAAQELDIDLIVMGSHSRTGLAAALLGSTTNGVLHLAACDVYAVRMT